MSSVLSAPAPEMVLNFRLALGLLTRYRILFACTVLLVTGLGTTWALLQPAQYDSRVVMVPVDEKSLTGLAGLVNQFSGLAAFGGWGMGKGGLKQEAMATLRSRELLEAFISENDLLPVLFIDAWDSDQGQWKTDEPSAVPTMYDGVELFKERHLNINDDAVTGVVTLSVRSRWPDVSASWANELVARMNDKVRLRAIDEAERSIKYLREQLEQTSLINIQQSINTSLVEQIKTITAARVRDQYAFRVIDPAVPGDLDNPDAPPRLIIIIIAFILSLILAVGLVMTVGYFSSRRANRRPG